MNCTYPCAIKATPYQVFACHGGKSGKNNNTVCPNIAAPTMQTQKGLRVRKNDSQEESSKRACLEESVRNIG